MAHTKKIHYSKKSIRFGNRLSIWFAYDQSFWNLESYKEQVNIIESQLFEIEKILNEMRQMESIKIIMGNKKGYDFEI